MICQEIPKNPLKCKFCSSEVCEKCYLNNEDYQCANCEQSVFINSKNEEIGQENKEKNYDDDNEDNYNKINENKDLSKNKCMLCSKEPLDPYECKNCEYKICEKCFLEQYEDEDLDKYHCENCNGTDFDKAKEEKLQNLDFLPGENEEHRKSEDKDNKEILSKDKCMYCSSDPLEPYACKNCGYKICEKCFLEQYEDEDFVQHRCKNCNETEFDKETNQNLKVEIIPKKDEKKKAINVIVDEDDENADVNNYNEIVEKKVLSKNKCMLCSNEPVDPYECKNCGYKICEKCFLEQYENEDFVQYHCENCDKTDFEKIKKENLNNLNLLQNKSENLRKMEEIENKEEEEDDDIDDNENDNYSQVLTNHLNIESRTEIGNYAKQFRNELMEVLNDKFNDFAEKSANEVYLKVLEKYIQINKEENVKMVQMNDKEILKTKAINEINTALKEKAIENFLSKIASQFFQDIVTKFKDQCELKLNGFINNLLNNEEANEFFKNCDEINGKKKLKFEKEKKEYLDNLLKKETESYKKSINYQEKIKGNNIGNNSSECPSDSKCASNSNCPSDSNCGNSQIISNQSNEN